MFPNPEYVLEYQAELRRQAAQQRLVRLAQTARSVKRRPLAGLVINWFQQARAPQPASPICCEAVSG